MKASSLPSSGLQRRKGGVGMGNGRHLLSTRVVTPVVIVLLMMFVAYPNWQFQVTMQRSIDTNFHSLNATIKSQYCHHMRSFQQLRRCTRPDRLHRTFPPEKEEDCRHIQSWEEVQHCLVGRTPHAPANGPYEIHIIGERNSGTKFLQDEIQRCFPKSDMVRAHRDFVRSKHFFQTPRQQDSSYRHDGSSGAIVGPYVSGMINNTGVHYPNSIVVSIFRDPVEWVASMHEKPYHSPAHIAGFDSMNQMVPLPWKDFVTKTWVTKRSLTDLQIIRSRMIHKTEVRNVCTQDFALHEVVPCIYQPANSSSSNNNDTRSIYIPEERLRGYYPIYELRRDKTGRPFNDILDLRREKIYNFLLEVPMLFELAGYLPVRYEDLMVFGTRAVMEKLAAMMNMELPEDCQPSFPQPDRLGKRVIPDDLRTWVRLNVDRNMERLLGYMA